MKHLITLSFLLSACGSSPTDNLYSDYTNDEEDAGNSSLVYKKPIHDASTLSGDACLNRTSINYQLDPTTWASAFFPIDTIGRAFSFTVPTSGNWTFSCAVMSTAILSYQTSVPICSGLKTQSAQSSKLLGASGYHALLVQSLAAGDILWLELWSDTKTSITCSAVLK